MALYLGSIYPDLVLCEGKGINTPILPAGRHLLLNSGASFPMGPIRASYVAKAAADTIDAAANNAIFVTVDIESAS